MKEYTTSLRKIIYTLFKRKYIVLTIFFSIVLTVTIGSYLVKPTYEASAKILVIPDVEAEKAMLFRVNVGYYQDLNERINSELEIIKSRPVAERVLEKLNLTNVSVKLLLARLSVNRLPESNIIDISYQSKNPQECADIVNQFMHTYVEYRAALIKDNKAYDFFDRQIDIADNHLNELEKRQAQFQQEQSLLAPDQQNQILLDKLSIYEQELTKIRTERMSRQARINIIHKQLENDSTTIIPSFEISDSPSQKDYLSQLKLELLSLELSRNRLLEEYTPTYDEVVKNENQIKSTKLKIKQEVELLINQEKTAIKTLLARESVLKSAIDDIYSQMKDRSQQVFQYSELSRGINDNREIYSMLLKQREEARISLAKTEELIKIRFVSSAVTPESPIKPKKALNIVLSIFLGLGIGVGMALVLEYFDHSISNEEDVERFLKLPLLTSIPEKN